MDESSVVEVGSLDFCGNAAEQVLRFHQQVQGAEQNRKGIEKAKERDESLRLKGEKRIE